MKYLILAVALTALQANADIRSESVQSVGLSQQHIYFDTIEGRFKAVYHCPTELHKLKEAKRVVVKPQSLLKENAKVAVRVDRKVESCVFGEFTPA